MAESNKPNDSQTESSLASEMGAIPKEPLLPVEKKLILGSLVLGVVLMGLLYWLSQALFPP